MGEQDQPVLQNARSQPAPSMNTLGFMAYVMHLGDRGTHGCGAGGETAKGIIA